MRITIAAIGRLKAGPERALLDRYVERLNAAGRKLALSLAIREVPESRAGSAATRMTQESEALLTALPQKATLVALEEKGKNLDSRAFAERIGGWRDSGVEDLAFAIGGADGHGPGLLARAELRLAFGALTWPHQLVRILLAEQLYRASTIIAGHPYHRE